MTTRGKVKLATRPLPPQLAVARLHLAGRRPYMSRALWAVQPVAAEGLDTWGMDRWGRLYVDPDTFHGRPLVEMPIPELGTIFCHELWHWLRKHAERGQALRAAQVLWNVCGDLEVNSRIAAEGLPHPATMIFPVDFGLPVGELAETYYARLRQHAPSHGPHGTGAGDCGSVADGQAREHELGEPRGTFSPHRRGHAAGDPAPGVSEAEAELIRQQVARDIADYAARHPGSVPAEELRWAESILTPLVNWTEHVRSVVARSLDHATGCRQPTYRRPNRRQAAYGPVLMPSWCDPRPRVWWYTDTSGSMGSDALSRCVAEIDGLLRQYPAADLTVAAIDAAVHTVRRVTRRRDVQLIGGGGTDMGAAIAHAQTVRPRPDLVIVATDGETPWPPACPPFRVVCVVVGDGPEPPAWATTVRVPAR